MLTVRKWGISCAFALMMTLGTLPSLAQPAMPPAVSADQTIPNMGVVKLQVDDYISSGRYDQECRNVTRAAQQYLAENLPRWQGHKPALVLDIDETSLSNWTNMKDYDYGYVPAKWDEWVMSAKAPAIVGTLELYRFARAHHVAVLFITGRGENQRAATELNLRNAGYDGWDVLVCRGKNEGSSIGEYKVAHRKQLTEQGYHIVLNVGDQISDLAGGYADGEFKLPNPMYFVK